jgi:hypothetical protein
MCAQHTYALTALAFDAPAVAAVGVAVDAWWGSTARTKGLPYAVCVLLRISLSFSLPVETTGTAVPVEK